MEVREKTNMEELELGDLLLLKNPRKFSLELKSQGPCLFIEYVDERRLSAVIYNIKSRRILRARINNLARIYSV